MNKELIDNISKIEKSDIAFLIKNFTAEDAQYAGQKARGIADSVYGRGVYIRGLIEISNYCKNNCYYCGIRCDNKKIDRYRLKKDTILSCCKEGYPLGFRTFVLQGGEDLYYTDERLTDIISAIKKQYPDCAVTLSLGERSEESYRKLFESGADRYLLRHETADSMHYCALHPDSMTLKNRIDCLNRLKEIGYQTGCGMMIGSPFQTTGNLAEDLIFIRSFQPEMVGMGPFIPQSDTPFADKPHGSVKLTLFLMSLVRIMLPEVLMPTTTALNTLSKSGRIEGLNAGANVIMPILSPKEDRKKYLIYDNKANTDNDAAEQLDIISEQLKGAGYSIAAGRGDYQNGKK